MIVTRLQYKNASSSKEFNQLRTGVISRSIFTGANITSAGLVVSISPFIASSYDGMVIISDTTQNVVVQDSVDSYVVCYAKYQDAAAPITQFVALDATTWATSANKDYYITFAKVTAAGGVVFGEDYSDSDFGEAAGKSSWKASVATAVDLPLTKNRAGDIRHTADDQHIYMWDTVSMSWVDWLPSATTLTYTNASNWADGATAYSPSTNVAAQFDKMRVDLATGDGLGKIMAGARDAWADATPNAASTASAALLKIVSDLATAPSNGAAKIRSNSVTNPIDGVYGPTNLYNVVSTIYTILGNAGRINGFNTWARQQTVHVLPGETALSCSGGAVGCTSTGTSYGVRGSTSSGSALEGQCQDGNALLTICNGAGVAGNFSLSGGSTGTHLRLNSALGDPSVPTNGNIWYTSNRLSMRISGTNRRIAEAKASRIFLYPLSAIEPDGGLYGTTYWTLNDHRWLKGSYNGGISIIGYLNGIVPVGCTVTQIRAHVTPANTRAAAGDRIRLDASAGVSGTAPASLFTTAYDDGTTSLQWITSVAFSYVMSASETCYFHLRSGTDTGTDQIFSVEITYTEGDYLTVL